MLDRLIALKKLNDAWNVCEHLNKDECWEKLGKAAIEHLNIEFGIFSCNIIAISNKLRTFL